eukprot:10157697-Lingulodinium_polyedra.AAC.1
MQSPTRDCACTVARAKRGIVHGSIAHGGTELCVNSFAGERKVVLERSAYGFTCAHSSFLHRSVG